MPAFWAPGASDTSVRGPRRNLDPAVQCRHCRVPTGTEPRAAGFCLTSVGPVAIQPALSGPPPLRARPTESDRNRSEGSCYGASL